MADECRQFISAAAPRGEHAPQGVSLPVSHARAFEISPGTGMAPHCDWVCEWINKRIQFNFC